MLVLTQMRGQVVIIDF